jgi:hypothetical protein
MTTGESQAAIHLRHLMPVIGHVPSDPGRGVAWLMMMMMMMMIMVMMMMVVVMMMMMMMIMMVVAISP